MEHYSPVRRGLQWEAAGKPAGGGARRAARLRRARGGFAPSVSAPGRNALRAPALPLRKPAKGRPLSPSFPPPPPAPAGCTPPPAGRFGSARPCWPHPTARRPFRLRRNTQAPPASAAGGGRACGRPSPPVCGAAGSLRSPPLTAPHLCSIIKTEPRYLCKMQYFVDDTDTRPSERNGRSYRYNYQNLTQQEEQ